MFDMIKEEIFGQMPREDIIAPFERQPRGGFNNCLHQGQQFSDTERHLPALWVLIVGGAGGSGTSRAPQMRDAHVLSFDLREKKIILCFLRCRIQVKAEQRVRVALIFKICFSD